MADHDKRGVVIDMPHQISNASNVTCHYTSPQSHLLLFINLFVPQDNKRIFASCTNSEIDGLPLTIDLSLGLCGHSRAFQKALETLSETQKPFYLDKANEVKWSISDSLLCLDIDMTNFPQKVAESTKETTILLQLSYLWKSFLQLHLKLKAPSSAKWSLLSNSPNDGCAMTQVQTTPSLHTQNGELMEPDGLTHIFDMLYADTTCFNSIRLLFFPFYMEGSRYTTSFQLLRHLGVQLDIVANKTISSTTTSARTRNKSKLQRKKTRPPFNVVPRFDDPFSELPKATLELDFDATHSPIVEEEEIDAYTKGSSIIANCNEMPLGPFLISLIVTRNKISSPTDGEIEAAVGAYVTKHCDSDIYRLDTTACWRHVVSHYPEMAWADKDEQKKFHYQIWAVMRQYILMEAARSVFPPSATTFDTVNAVSAAVVC